MHGTWLMLLGRWITREETFERMVSPAIADMQLEASQGRSRWRHYVGLCLVLIHAALHDLRLDVSVAFDHESRRVAWKRAGIWYVASVAVFTFLGLRYDTPWKHTGPAIWIAALTSALLKAVITAPMLGIVPAVLCLHRRASSRRAVVTVVLIAGVVTVLAALALRPIRMFADQAIYKEVQAGMATTPGVLRGSQSGAGDWLNFKANDINPRVTGWEALQMGAWVIAHACSGVVLAHGRSVVPRVIGLLLTWVLFVRFSRGFTLGLSLTAQRWKDILLVFTVASVWLVCDAMYRRVATPRQDLIEP